MLFDSDYWGEMAEWIRGELLADGMVSHGDLDLLHLTDDPDHAVQLRARPLPRRAPTSRSRSCGRTKYGPGGFLPGP